LYGLHSFWWGILDIIIVWPSLFLTSVRACDGESNTFSIKIRLHQGSVLSPYIFTLVMEEITKDIQGDIPWGMLFVDDVVLIDESRIRVDQKLEL
jgi:Reverse transcriptase (RNA-dependent DNA polymerase)